MNKRFRLTVLPALSVFLYSPAGFTQDEEPTTETTQAPASQEVEVNEDNYRQFMELKDTRRQRSVLPENAFKPQSGLHKLDELPEESQKHLRNQLREIIVQGDQWQPGDEQSDYPYVPSEAATKDQSLKKKEAEAWGELLESYHHREAEIHANASRSKAATTAANESAGASDSTDGQSQDTSQQVTAQAAKEGQQASQDSASERSTDVDSYSPNSSNQTESDSTKGTSQNALEYLMGKEAGGGQAEKKDTLPDQTSPLLQRDSEGDIDDTLSIEELRNAQGVGDVTEAILVPGATDEEEQR